MGISLSEGYSRKTEVPRSSLELPSTAVSRVSRFGSGGPLPTAPAAAAPASPFPVYSPLLPQKPWGFISWVKTYVLYLRDHLFQHFN